MSISMQICHSWRRSTTHFVRAQDSSSQLLLVTLTIEVYESYFISSFLQYYKYFQLALRTYTLNISLFSSYFIPSFLKNVISSSTQL